MEIKEWTPGEHGPTPPPGAYAGMPEYLYHRHPALSSTGAKKLTAPSTPAHYRSWRDTEQEPRRDFEIGRAAHTVVLGTGAPLHVVEAATWQTKAAKEERQLARDLNRIPVLAAEYEEIQAMADAIRSHPVASVLFARQRYEGGQLLPATGTPEVSLFWHDPLSGIDKRCRLDWLPSAVSESGALYVPDYKTCNSASDDAISRALRDYGYHQQAEWNTEGIHACGLNVVDGGVLAPVVFLFVFQEKTAPYLINVKAIEDKTFEIASRKNFEAAQVFRRCMELGEWPGYPFGIGRAQLPYWDLRRELEAQ